MFVKAFYLILCGIVPIPLILILINISEIIKSYQTSFGLGIMATILAMVFIWYWGEKIYLDWFKKSESKTKNNKNRK